MSYFNEKGESVSDFSVEYLVEQGKAIKASDGIKKRAGSNVWAAIVAQWTEYTKMDDSRADEANSSNPERRLSVFNSFADGLQIQITTAAGAKNWTAVEGSSTMRSAITTIRKSLEVPSAAAVKLIEFNTEVGEWCVLGKTKVDKETKAVVESAIPKTCEELLEPAVKKCLDAGFAHTTISGTLDNLLDKLSS